MNPRRANSCKRFSACGTPRTSPPNPTSPKKAQVGSTGTFFALESTAAITPRSAAGSRIPSPPTTFRNTSAAPSRMSRRFSSTARSMATRWESSPLATRRGTRAPVGLTRACTSSRMGRVPSSVATTMQPVAWGGRSARNRAEGLSTGARPSARISKTPISSVGPKRFLVARRMR